VIPRPSSAAARYLEGLALQARRDNRPICFDSAPLIDFLAGQQPTAGLVRPLLDDPSLQVVLSTVTLAEAVGRSAARQGRAGATTVRTALLALPGLTFVGFDDAHAIEAALVRAETGLKLPDAAIVATARLAGAGALLGNDRQWRGKPLGVPYHHLDDVLALP